MTELLDMTDEIPAVQAIPELPAARRGRTGRPLPPAVQRIVATPNVLTFAGLAVTVVGFVLIAVAWGKAASLGNVAQQLPYLMSGGLVGVGLVACGLTLIAIQAKLNDGQQRSEQNADLIAHLDALLVQQEGGR